MQKFTTSLMALIIATTTTSMAQLKTPQPSPTQSLTQAFGLGEIKIEYSRPSVKGRTIFGDLVREEQFLAILFLLVKYGVRELINLPK